MKTLAMYLDRDGTLIHDSGYLSDPDEVQPIIGAVEALVELQHLGYNFVVISNQSGIARGLITEHQANLVNARFVEAFAQFGITFAGIYYCPHGPTDHCECRKPKPGMLLRASQDLTLPRAGAWMIGDKPSDIIAGSRAGCRTAQLLWQDGSTPCHLATCTATSWHMLLRRITSQHVPEG